MLTSYNATLIELANYIGPDLAERSLHSSPWIDLVDTGMFPENVGDLVSTMIAERTFPTGTIAWENMMGANAVASGSVAAQSIFPPVLTIDTAKRLQEYRLQHTSLQSGKFNANDLRTAHIAEKQLSAIRNNLSANTDYLWQTRSRQEYDRLTKHVALVASGTHVESDSGSTADTTNADGLLTNQNLKKYRQRMIRMQAGRRALAMKNGAPIFGLICDSEVSEALRLETSIAEALKFDGRAAELLNPLGVDGAYQNFAHIIDDLAPRYTWGGSSYTEVQPYVTEAEDTANGKFGTRLIENTAYESAAYTRSYIFHQDVMKLLYPNTVSGVAGTSFDPVSYRGEWSWVNIRNVDRASAEYNPDGTQGFFRGVFSAATEPCITDFGFSITHLRPGFSAS